MQNLCKSCEKKDKCTELCSTALKYVSRDYIKRDKNIIYTDSIHEKDKLFGWGPINGKSDTRIVYEMSFLDRKSVYYISKYVKFSIQGIYDIIDRLRKSIKIGDTLSSKILKLHFINHEPHSYISKYLNCSLSYVYRIINAHIEKNTSK